MTTSLGIAIGLFPFTAIVAGVALISREKVGAGAAVAIAGIAWLAVLVILIAVHELMR